MPDNHDNPSGEKMRTTPQYRVRTPEGETSAPKSAQNAAASPTSDMDAKPGDNAANPSDLGKSPDKETEIGGPKGPEPTRFGDWERDGRCVDF